MRHRIFIPAATALLFALAACTQDELAGDNRLPEGEYPVVIRATGLSVEATPQAAPSTRATVDGDWQGVTSVALKTGDAVKEYTVTASTDFKSATLSRENDPHYWTSRDPITVSAWWPFDNADITQMPAVKVAEDQSQLADFQNSDFISAENQTVKFDDPTLEFTHRTARVAIELKPGTGFTSVAGATVSLVSLSADNGNPTAIKTYNASGNTYEALTAPQTVAAGKPFVKVELGGGTFYFRPQNNVVLEAGSRYKYTVKVNTTGLTLEGCTIGEWADGGGESGAAEDLGYIYDSNTKTYTVYNADGLLAWNEASQKDESINCTLTADIDNGSWHQIDENDPRLNLSEGKLEIRAAEKQFTLTNLRYYNWEQEAAEKAFDAQSNIVREAIADKNSQGLVVDISADYYNEDDTVPYIKNGSPLDVHLKGEFETQHDTATIIKTIEGKKAFAFTGKESYRSNFMLPATIRDNAPYTIEAWILNPEIAENECVADFTSSHDELEKLMLVNGTEPRCGVMNHYGWYEDAGYKEMKTLEGKWQHVYVCFDGRIESIYINDKLISQKDIQLLVKPSQFMLLGKNAEEAWPFSGYLHSLKLWDEYIPYKKQTK
mgnify:CR=1 FL=1